MNMTKPLAFGRRQGRVVKVNNTPSEKLKTFSTIISFFREVDTPYGKSIATEGFFGVALTEQMPTDLKAGDKVDVEIVSYQSGINPNDPQGRETLQARVILFGKAVEGDTRVSAAAPAGQGAVGTQA